jgi:hypothetical protein
MRHFLHLVIETAMIYLVYDLFKRFGRVDSQEFPCVAAPFSKLKSFAFKIFYGNFFFSGIQHQCRRIQENHQPGTRIKISQKPGMYLICKPGSSDFRRRRTSVD